MCLSVCVIAMSSFVCVVSGFFVCVLVVCCVFIYVFMCGGGLCAGIRVLTCSDVVCPCGRGQWPCRKPQTSNLQGSALLYLEDHGARNISKLDIRESVHHSIIHKENPTK
jgi:hypothetical protein